MWRGVVGAAVLAVGVAAVAQQLLEDRHEQRLARAAEAGPPLDEPLVQVWQVDARGSVGMHEDVLIVGDPDGSGLVGLDTWDGSARWHADRIAEAWGCQVVPVDPPATTPTASAAVAEPALVACYGTGGDGQQVHVLDVTTGTLVRTVETGVTGSSTVLAGPDLAAVGLAEDEHLVAARWSLRTGEQRWSYRSPAPLSDEIRSQQTYELRDDVLGARIGSWQVALDAETGKLLPTPAPGAHEVVEVNPSTGELLATTSSDDTVSRELSRTPLGDGSVAVVRTHGETVRTEVRAGDGTLLWERAGHALRPGVDDGSAPGLLLMAPAGSGLSGVDVRTGEERWTHTVRGTGTVGEPLVLSSLVLVATGTGRSGSDADGGLVALDATSGRVVWQHAVGELVGWRVLTDGRRVLTLDRVDGSARLVARDVVTGGIAWSTPVPDDGHSVDLLPSRGVLVTGDDHVSAFRPPTS